MTHPVGLLRGGNEDGAGAGVAGLEEALEIELPTSSRRLETHVARLRAHRVAAVVDVRPDRRDEHEVVAVVEQGLASDHNSGHTRAEAGYPLDVEGNFVQLV